MYDVHRVTSSTTSGPQFWIIGTSWIRRAVDTPASYRHDGAAQSQQQSRRRRVLEHACTQHFSS